MAFSDKIKNEAIWRSKRSCCVCKEFVGRSVQVHHIIPEGQGGADEIDNAIVLCLRCHAEAGHYNPGHPIGTKYSREELRRYRDEWWKWCKENPLVPPPKIPIKVSPSEVKLRAGKWRSRVKVKLHNATDNFYYQIQLSIKSLTPGFSPEHIHIQPPEIKDEVSIGDSKGHYVLALDLMIFVLTDETGQKQLLLQIADLDPHETYTMILINNAPYKSPQTATSTAYIEVVDFNTEPSDVLLK